jgi:hypothetical protein
MIVIISFLKGGVQGQQEEGELKVNQQSIAIFSFSRGENKQ